MRRFFHIAKKRSERGIAIVFVLGILGLLTVIGLGFAATAMLDQKMASNNVNVDRATYLAKSGVARAFQLLQAGVSSDVVVSRDPRSYGATGATTASGTFDWLWRVNTILDGIDIFSLPAKFTVTDIGKNKYVPTWQYVFNADNTEILGRFAYVVKEDKGKMDPSVHFNRYLAKKFASADYDLDKNKLKRFGTTEAELDFTHAIDDTLTPSNLPFRMYNVLVKDTGENTSIEKPFSAPVRWQDLVSLFDNDDLDLTSATESKLTPAIETLQVGASETYWIDIDNDMKQTTDEMLFRFNLGRTDWDEDYFDKVYILFGLDKDGNRIKEEKLINGMVKTCDYNARYSGNKNLQPQKEGSKCYDTGGIQWFGKDGSGDDYVKRQQIAANIIQYCRSADKVSVTDCGSTWGVSAAEPKYVGVGKHPMLNEAAICFKILGSLNLVSESGTLWKTRVYEWKYEYAVKIGAELIDMFNIGTKEDSFVRFHGKVSFKYYVPKDSTLINSGEWRTIEIPISGTGAAETVDDVTSDALAYEFKFENADWTSNGYTKNTETGTDKFWRQIFSGTKSGTVTVTATTLDADSRIKIKDIELKIDKVYLGYNNTKNEVTTLFWRDFAKIDRTFKSSDEHTVTSDTWFYAGAEASDPRVNNNKDDWTTVDMQKDSLNNYADHGSPGSQNRTITNLASDGEISKFGDVYDKENPKLANFPALQTVSTAYIAQRPMLSLWELGAISRAEPWRTINLKKTVPHPNSAMLSGGKDHGFAFGDENYKKGDGNILDQVKINRLRMTDDQEKDLFRNSSGGLPDGFSLSTEIPTTLEDFWIERIASFGKININTNLQKVLGALFQGINFNNTSTYNYYSYIGCVNKTEPGSAISSAAARSLADTIIAQQNTKSPAAKMSFNSRCDLLLPLNNTNTILTALYNSGSNDAAQEQLIGKTMNLIKAEPTDKAYIIAVGQTIKSVKTTSERYVDWNKDGTIEPENESEISHPGNDQRIRKAFTGNYLAYKNAGYVRYPMMAEIHGDSTNYADKRLRGVVFGDEKIKEKISDSKEKTKYVNGIDQILGTSKIVVTLERIDGKWKIVRYENVD